MVVMGRLALWWWSCIPWNRYSHRSAPNWSQWCVGGVFNGLKVQGVVVVAADGRASLGVGIFIGVKIYRVEFVRFQ